MLSKQMTVIWVIVAWRAFHNSERLIQNHQIIINTQQNKCEREMRVEYTNEE